MFYVYQYLREDGTPYYIGKGKGNRAHYKGKHERIRKPIDKSRIVIIESGLLESEAIDLEIKLIAKYGRKDIGTGILQNMTDGGDGVSGAKFGRPPEERILKIANANRGKKRTDEVKKKLSEIHTGKKDSAETKAKKSQSARKAKTKEHAENIRKSKLGEKNPMFGKPSPNRGKPMSQEQKEKIRISVLKRLAEKQNSK